MHGPSLVYSRNPSLRGPRLRHLAYQLWSPIDGHSPRTMDILESQERKVDTAPFMICASQARAITKQLRVQRTEREEKQRQKKIQRWYRKWVDKMILRENQETGRNVIAYRCNTVRIRGPAEAVCGSFHHRLQEHV